MRVLMVHAHPDDETLATGALIADLVASGHEVVVLTATRGEEGEVVPGSIPYPEHSPEFVAAREAELAGALAVLGVTDHAFLGTPPARVQGAPERRYLDSGMRWVTPTLAGPREGVDEGALTSAPLAEVVDDLVAFIEAVDPDQLISYDHGGGYGHPDHVRCHEATLLAARRTGLEMVEVVSHPDAFPEDGHRAVEWHDLSRYRSVVEQALDSHRSQLTVIDGRVRHVGGQEEEIALRIGLCRVPVERVDG